MTNHHIVYRKSIQEGPSYRTVNNSEPLVRNLESEVKNTEPYFNNMESDVKNIEPDVNNMEPGVSNMSRINMKEYGDIRRTTQPNWNTEKMMLEEIKKYLTIQNNRSRVHIPWMFKTSEQKILYRILTNTTYIPNEPIKTKLIKNQAVFSNNTGGIDSCFQYKNDCQVLHYSNTTLPLTTLTSFPGSGNTWVRHLIQQLTGIYTGSVYYDKGLEKRGFPAEALDDPTDGSVIAIKCHNARRVFHRMIALIRDPRDALIANFKRMHSAGHKTDLSKARFFQPALLKEFSTKCTKGGIAWSNHMSVILQILRDKTVPVLIIHYNNLLTNLKKELYRLADFLNVEITEDLLDCIQCNLEGSHHRNVTERFDPYTKKQRDVLNAYIERFNHSLTDICGIECAMPSSPME
ncbi:unnamed protein product [Owenia fusiformis]|uniref:Uncharacterized protein n=1 Tax=Owenia fusiformis TaxID=6347 RepID=A0A8J1TN07_OWEFU|nr:unnamed protein product [Owenia fusiformis]